VTEGARARADRVALAIATVGGAGYAPVAPGTVGSAITVAALWLLPFSIVGLTLFLCVVLVVGTWAAGRAERLMGRKDPGAIVIDEVAGMTISLMLAPRNLGAYALAFLFFRIFDVIKPFPARQSQRITGGVGVMIDDVIAGFYALAVTLALNVFLRWP
jgi:phosphatidylglycerophosphatase A